MRLCIICFLLISLNSFCQKNVLLQSLYYNTDYVFLSSTNELIFYNEFYSDTELPLGKFPIDDSLVLSKIKLEKSHFKYFIKNVYERDSSSNEFILRENSVSEEIVKDKLRKISFKKLKKKRLDFKCKNDFFSDLKYIKKFTSSSLIIKEINKKEVNLKFIENNCQVVYDENYSLITHFFEKDNYVILKNSNELILIGRW